MEKINIAELLKDCASGVELYSPLFGDCKFVKVHDYEAEIIVEIETGANVSFKTDGRYYDYPNAECLLFPKGKTTWKGFIPLCQFKDGDIIYTHTDALKCNLKSTFISIFKECSDGKCRIYAGYSINTNSFYSHHSCNVDDIIEQRLATEEEKAKLFQAIKDNGYEWNAETKTLEKLEDVEDKGNISDGYHTFNELYEYRLLYNASMFNELAKQGLYDVHKSKFHSDGTIPFGDENWFIVQAELPTGQISNHYEMKDWDLFQVPIKEKANQYDGHTPQDVAKRLRDFLTLGKLLKFKVGDRIRYKVDPKFVFTITNITKDKYECGKNFCVKIY